MRRITALLLTGVLVTACTDEVDQAPVESDPVPLEETVVDRMVIDLGLDGDDSWYAVNDTVMGGVSEGFVDYTDDTLVFSGTVSTDSNGGFTSVRSVSDDWDLSEYTNLVVRLKSEGQPFTLIFADSPNWWEGQFRYDIEDIEEGWNEVVIPLVDFEFYDMNTGYPESTGEKMRRGTRKNIVHMEFMSKLFEDGSFRLEVDHLTFE
ncbi:MAG: hypothetical protein GWP91_07745 [Rhodobacterales bacterium]|nr:hypothetical protein [Rhodobacterales bacterium]